MLLAEKIELIEKKKIYFQCHFSEWSIFQYELNTQDIEYKEQYTADGVEVEALLQIHQIVPLKLKVQDVTRGREQLKLLEDIDE